MFPRSALASPWSLTTPASTRRICPIDEPIFFHQGNDRRPLELVVNSVAKDKVTGYISVPKAAGTQTASSD